MKFTSLVRIMIAVVGPLAITAGLALWLYLPSAAQSNKRRVLDSSPHWVSFSALQRTSDPAANRDTVARFYQGADGSTRLESGPNLADPTVIDIKNIEQKRQYVRTFGKWTSYQMYPRADYAFNPPKAAVGGSDGAEGIEADPWPSQVRGFTVHRLEKNAKWEDDKGNVRRGSVTTFYAPLLNLLPILMTSSLGGVVEYYDIKLGPQPPILFMPPQNADVMVSVEPGGIINAAEAKKAGLDYQAFVKDHNAKAHQQHEKK